ncbi:MAG: AraC family transcriptional regulator [Actinomycetota bacterium]|nr:AraC family transcriptional regulator [Actinomycetota bacterium]
MTAAPMASVLADLHRGLPHVMFSLKGTDGRYVTANQAFADRAGCASPAEVVGRTAAELFPTELARTYEAQDRRVVDGGRAVRGELEMITRPDGTIGWYVTTKTPIPGADGEITGIVAISVDLGTASDHDDAMGGLVAALALVRERFAESLRVDDLAAAAGMSRQQLERRMRRTMGVSAKQYVLRVRLDEATRLLATTALPIAEVATRCGFYDQAALTRRFRRAVGMTPRRYRDLHHP